MESNAGKYSMAGVAESTLAAVGIHPPPIIKGIIETAGGNEVTDAYFAIFGHGDAAAGHAASLAENIATNRDLIGNAVGKSLSYGRRSADIMALNIAGETGLPRALSTASPVRSLFGTAGRIFGLGLSFTQRLVIDGVFTAAEAVSCAAR